MIKFTLLIRCSGWEPGCPADLENGPVLMYEGHIGDPLSESDMLSCVASLEDMESEDLELKRITDGMVSHHIIDLVHRKGEVMYKVLSMEEHTPKA